MTGIGHNKGPTSEGGLAWRKHCWKRARADLLPHLPIEILRGRVKRARELGLDYKTYASVRAATGHDVVGFLFSSNALRVFRGRAEIPQDRLQKLAGLKNCAHIALVTKPLTTEMLMAANPQADLRFFAAPGVQSSWSDIGRSVRASLRPQKSAPDTMLLIGDTALEREWSTAGRLAGYLPAARFFSETPL